MIMGTFNSSQHGHNQDQEEEEISTILDLQYLQSSAAAAVISPPPNVTTNVRQLLISCAEMISQSDYSSAQRLISFFSYKYSSPYGDSTERLVHRFATALSLRLKSLTSASASASLMIAGNNNNFPNSSRIITTMEHEIAGTDDPVEAMKSCYLSVNQITPFIRFSHLTANQAILEAIDEAQQAIHILDFDIMHGLQWPPFMQALADRNSLYPPPMLRITATGRDLDFLLKTGNRLSNFADSLGLQFQFHPLLILSDQDHHRLIPSALHLFPNETLVVNCVLYLHRLLKEDLVLLLHKIKGLNPRVVTIAEREANHNHPFFLQRFVEALDHYSAIFESLEATLPANSRERLTVEEVWLGREIMEILVAEEENRRKRHERYENWELMLRSAGFANIPLSPFALSQAKLLLRLHYPSEGYHLQICNDTSFFLGWQNRPLFSVSSWH